MGKRPAIKLNNPHFLLFIAVLLLATALRLYHLPTLPPGLNFDEAGNGVAALDILHGQFHLWWRIGGGKEPLWPYLIALSTTLLGNVPLALRLPATFGGILTVAAVYPLIYRLFRSVTPYAKMLALLTMLGLALSGWHLHFSRLGFRAGLLPLLSALAFYFFWRGIFIHNQPSLRKPLVRTMQHTARFTFHVSRFTFFLAALFTALAIYAYLAGRLLPFVPLAFLLFCWFITKIHRNGSTTTDEERNGFLSQNPHNWESQSRSIEVQTPASITHSLIPNPQLLLTNYYLPLLLLLLPLIIYFLYHPADFVARSGTVSIFNPEQNNGDLLGTLWRTATLTLGTFLGLTGDSNPLVNLPHAPALPFFLAPFFLLGLIISFYATLQAPISRPQLHPLRQAQDTASIQPHSSVYSGCCGLLSIPNLQSPNPPIPQSPNLPLPHSPHLFLLTWWLIMLLPALLAPEGAPHHLRLLGTIIPTYAFVALGVTATAGFLAKIRPHPSIRPRASVYSGCGSLLKINRKFIFYGIPTIVYLLLASQTVNNYFFRWPATDFTLPFDRYAVRLATDIAQAPPAVSYVLPMDIRAAAEARHYTLDYLLAGTSAAYNYIPVDERNAETGLTAAARGHTELRVVRWRQDKHRAADEKEIVTYLLERGATFQERETFPVYDVETYRLASQSVDFRLPAIDHPNGANFDGLLRLEATFVPPTIAAGESLPVALTLAPIGPLMTDYRASVRLIGPGGERVAQKDRTLRHNFHQGTSLWPPETVNEYYLLPLPPETPPGDYTIVLVIYHPESQAPLVAAGVVEVPLGQVRVQ